MGTIERFEDIEAWKKARILVLGFWKKVSVPILFLLCATNLFAQQGPAEGANVANVYAWGSSGASSTTWNSTSNWTAKGASGSYPGNGSNTQLQFARIDSMYSNFTVSPVLNINSTTTNFSIGGMSVDTYNSSFIRRFNLNVSNNKAVNIISTVPLSGSSLLTGNVEIYSSNLTITNSVASGISENYAALIIYGALDGYIDPSYSVATETIYQVGISGQAMGLHIYAFSSWSGINSYQKNASTLTYVNLIYCNSLFFDQGAGIASQYYASVLNTPAASGAVEVYGNFVVGQKDPSVRAVNDLGGYGGLMVEQNAVLRMGANATLQTYSVTLWGSALGEDHSQSYTSTAAGATTRAYIDTWTNSGNTIQIIGTTTLQYAMSFYNLTVGDASTVGTLTLDGNIYVQNLTIDANATLNANGKQITVYGNFTNNGTFTAGTSTVTFSSTTSNQSISGATTFNNLTISNGGGFAVTPSSNETVSGTFTVSAGGKFAMGVNTILTLKAAPTLTGTFDTTTNTPNTIQYIGTFTMPNVTYSYLEIGDGSTSGTVTSGSGTTTVNKTMEIYASATYTVAAGATTTMASGSGLTVDSIGTISLGDGATAAQLQFASGVTATINGTFKTANTGSNPVPIVTNNGSGTFTFTLKGAINVSGLYFLNGDVNGMNISTTATFTSFANIYFNNAASGGNHLTITQNSGGQVSATTVYFDITPANVSNARTGAHNASVSSTTTPFTILFMTSNDDPSGATGTGRGLALNGSSNTNVGQAVWVNNMNKTPNALATGATPEYVFPGNQYAYQLVHATSGDVLTAYNSGVGTTAGTYTISSALYGSIVGRPLVIPLDSTGHGGAFGAGTDNIFFGTNKGWIYRLGYNMSLYSNYPDNLAGAMVEVYSSVISDTGWVDTYTNNYGTNIYFAARAVDGTAYFYGLDMTVTQSAGVHAYVNTVKDTVDGTPAGDNFPRFGGSGSKFKVETEPAVDALNISGNLIAFFIGTTAYSGSKGHIWRITKQHVSNDTDYSGTTPPNSDIRGPVNEFLGVLTVGSSDTINDTVTAGTTPRVYLINGTYTNSLPDYNISGNFPVAAGSAVDGGVDTDFVSEVDYGTKLGYFVVKGFTQGAGVYYTGFPIQPDGTNAIKSFPLYNINTSNKNEFFFGNSNGKVYKVFFGNGDGNDGKYILSNDTTTTTATPFLNIGAGINITGLSVSAGQLFVSADNGALYVVNMGN